MKRCANCNSLMPDDVSQCIRCAYDSVDTSPANKRETLQAQTAQAITAQDHTAENPQNDDRKIRRNGLLLIGVGALLQVFAGGLPLVGLAGLAICATSLGYCAYRFGRSWMWALVGMFPFLGAVIGFVFLITVRRVAQEPGKPKPLSEGQLKWGWIVYAVILWYVPLQGFVRDGMTCVRLPDPQYPPLDLIEGFDCGVAVVWTVSYGILATVALLHISWRAIKTYGVRVSSLWLALRAIIVGITLAYGFTALHTMKSASELVDSRIVQTLSQLKVGMPRAVVERIVLEANAALVPPDQTWASIARRGEASEYRKVRDAMTGVQQGQSIKLSDFRFHRALFNAKMDPLDEIAAPKPSASEELYVRSCCQVMFSWTRFDLFVQYDNDDRLETARYLRSHHADGRDTSNVLIMKIP